MKFVPRKGAIQAGSFFVVFETSYWGILSGQEFTRTVMIAMFVGMIFFSYFIDTLITELRHVGGMDE